MSTEIKTINSGGVNCHLVKTGDGYILIDTGLQPNATTLIKDLKARAASLGILSSSY